MYVACGGTHDDFDAFDRVMAAERRLAVLVDVERVLQNRSRLTVPATADGVRWDAPRDRR